jgi:chorismate mutase/prephenate dehydratase
MQMYALGPRGTNGHEAAEKAALILRPKIGTKRPPAVDVLKSHIDVLEQTLKHSCLGLVAIENDGQGLVGEVVSYFAHDRPSAQVIGDIVLPIQHDVFIHEDADERQIRWAISHRQALDQSREHREKLGLAEGTATTSTAEAARLVANKEVDWKHTAAVASPYAGKIYKLKQIHEHVEDEPGNTTRFYILGPKQRMTNGNGGKTALIFGVPDKHCALAHALLSIGSGDGVNISSLDRVRLGSKANSVFWCEFDAHAQSAEGRNVLRRLHTFVSRNGGGKPRIRILGSWST